MHILGKGESDFRTQKLDNYLYNYYNNGGEKYFIKLGLTNAFFKRKTRHLRRTPKH